MQRFFRQESVSLSPYRAGRCPTDTQKQKVEELRAQWIRARANLDQAGSNWEGAVNIGDREGIADYEEQSQDAKKACVQAKAAYRAANKAYKAAKGQSGKS